MIPIDDLIKGISPEVNTAYNGKNAPTVSEAKDTVAEKKGKMKNSFWNWLLTFDIGKKISKIPPTNITIKEINGKPVVIAKLRFGKTSGDLSTLGNQTLVLINGFIKKNDEIKTFKIGKAYIKGKNKDLSSTESWVMNIDENGNASDFYEEF